MLIKKKGRERNKTRKNYPFFKKEGRKKVEEGKSIRFLAVKLKILSKERKRGKCKSVLFLTV